MIESTTNVSPGMTPSGKGPAPPVPSMTPHHDHNTSSKHTDKANVSFNKVFSYRCTTEPKGLSISTEI